MEIQCKKLHQHRIQELFLGKLRIKKGTPLNNNDLEFGIAKLKKELIISNCIYQIERKQNSHLKLIIKYNLSNTNIVYRLDRNILSLLNLLNIMNFQLKYYVNNLA